MHMHSSTIILLASSTSLISALPFSEPINSLVARANAGLNAIVEPVQRRQSSIADSSALAEASEPDDVFELLEARNPEAKKHHHLNFPGSAVANAQKRDLESRDPEAKQHHHTNGEAFASAGKRDLESRDPEAKKHHQASGQVFASAKRDLEDEDDDTELLEARDPEARRHHKLQATDGALAAGIAKRDPEAKRRLRATNGALAAGIAKRDLDEAEADEDVLLEARDPEAGKGKSTPSAVAAAIGEAKGRKAHDQAAGGAIA